MLAILYYICLVFIILHIVSPKRTAGERWFSIGVIGVSFLMNYTIGWGWLLVMAWGAFCWAGARAGEN